MCTNCSEAPALLTLAEASLVLRVEQRTLRNLARRGKIPGVVELEKGVFRFNRETLYDWIRTAGLSHRPERRRELLGREGVAS